MLTKIDLWIKEFDCNKVNNIEQVKRTNLTINKLLTKTHIKQK